LADRLNAIAKQLGIPSTHVFAAGFTDQKPLPGIYRRAMAVMKATSATTVMVGDQIFSDMLGANLLGIYTIFVWPLGGGDHPVTLLKRFPEAFLLWWWGFRKNS
jgi:predicted HAD superfamily phosphohydrolase YqeG